MFVDFFFVLSGFVITHAYSSRVKDRREFFGFAIRRFGRLWPLHTFLLFLFIGLESIKWIALAFLEVTAGDEPFSDANSTLAIFTNLALIHSLGMHDTETWNGPSWSISTELWANIIFAILLITARRYFLLSSSALIIFSIVILFVFREGNLGATYDFGMFRCLYGFFAGAILNKIYERVTFNLPLLPSSLLEIATLVMVAAYATYPNFLHTNMYTPIIFSFAIYVFSQEAGLVSRLLKFTPLLRLGEWSYSIYLVHFFVLSLLMGAVRVIQQLYQIELHRPVTYDGRVFDMISIGNAWTMDALTLLYLVTVIALSALTYRYVEVPSRTYFNTKAKTLNFNPH